LAEKCGENRIWLFAFEVSNNGQCCQAQLSIFAVGFSNKLTHDSNNGSDSLTAMFSLLDAKHHIQTFYN